jgi:hypothetical protein
MLLCGDNGSNDGSSNTVALAATREDVDSTMRVGEGRRRRTLRDIQNSNVGTHSLKYPHLASLMRAQCENV